MSTLQFYITISNINIKQFLKSFKDSTGKMLKFKSEADYEQ